ncbi:hypothetical protein QR680_014263 [Steinernema hermaphroditum]|uniref:Tudor domain-containing protein n=1 Tax=Steinernema hermaphroditum TaxID=289476 RepID=A0AA39I8A9_9BILA|nr:hypothetical protein QR680_014263 [Steinernema hermaphroditum]
MYRAVTVRSPLFVSSLLPAAVRVFSIALCVDIMSFAARANLLRTLPYVVVGGAGVLLAIYIQKRSVAVEVDSDSAENCVATEVDNETVDNCAATEVDNETVDNCVVAEVNSETVENCVAAKVDNETVDNCVTAEVDSDPVENCVATEVDNETVENCVAAKEDIAAVENYVAAEVDTDGVENCVAVNDRVGYEELDSLVAHESIHDLLKNQQPSFDWTEAAGDHVGYEDADSPVGSEVSADSGRASGGMACSLSPGVGDGEHELLPMYEFEIPNTLVGLIIGIRGKTIKELCVRADVKMIIRPHHNPEKADTHQICTVEGKRDCINKCLRLLRRRFPSNRFPDLNLKPVMPPPMPCPAAEIFGSQPTNLALPDAVRCEVVVSSMLNPGHFFVQQPTHPTFSQLQRLDRYMLGIYSQTTGIPDLPQPCAIGLLCVAPSLSGWFRAVTMAYYEDQDEVLIRYVDYGGYARLPRSDLRQIRTDLMTLPFQATECYLANVQPADGTSQWGELANEEFQQLFMNKIVEARVVGYNIEDQIPVVELFALNGDSQQLKLDKYLLDKDLAKAADPSKVVPVSPQ